ncbi:hypothetical protein DV113_004887 [Geotrichum candidum]|uniref:Uncharacterized protein n=1 Tax=Geotrichum candidum TaxID=1173061 RepID=A0A0J9XDT0_GEOCN|nr:hypothetical protein DV454_003342 [Geotrichum candidum]KAF5114698.1 hypothetical protein DV452_003227 [Geotrichum candidum]KAF7497089.1 hypothetical protein DV113_004887 [Geotrichum candidum]KAI8134343.1 hypothetical protein DUD61_001983 [Geotrichum candidum]CDO55677.1 hypothetical protein, no similarity [Geotrichum candidum]
MQRTAATQFVKTATRTMSVSSSNVAGTAGASRAAAFAREHVSSPSNQYMKSPSKPSLRMRIIINGRGIVQTQELSSIRPTIPGSMSRFHTSAIARSFHPEVYSEGTVVMAGDEVHDPLSFSAVRSDTSSSSSEFKVGQVNAVSNTEYSD